MLKRITYVLLLGIAFLIITGCSDDVKEEIGPRVDIKYDQVLDVSLSDDGSQVAVIFIRENDYYVSIENREYGPFDAVEYENVINYNQNEEGLYQVNDSGLFQDSTNGFTVTNYRFDWTGHDGGYQFGYQLGGRWYVDVSGENYGPYDEVYDHGINPNGEIWISYRQNSNISVLYNGEIDGPYSMSQFLDIEDPVYNNIDPYDYFYVSSVNFSYPKCDILWWKMGLSHVVLDGEIYETVGQISGDYYGNNIDILEYSSGDEYIAAFEVIYQDDGYYLLINGELVGPIDTIWTASGTMLDYEQLFLFNGYPFIQYQREEESYLWMNGQEFGPYQSFEYYSSDDYGYPIFTGTTDNDTDLFSLNRNISNLNQVVMISVSPDGSNIGVIHYAEGSENFYIRHNKDMYGPYNYEYDNPLSDFMTKMGMDVRDNVFGFVFNGDDETTIIIDDNIYTLDNNLMFLNVSSSPDGKHNMYVYYDYDTGVWIIENGKKKGPYYNFEMMGYTPVSQLPVYYYNDNEEDIYVRIGDENYGPFEDWGIEGQYFPEWVRTARIAPAGVSPDGKHYYFIWFENSKAYLRIDDEDYGPYDEIVCPYQVFMKPMNHSETNYNVSPLFRDGSKIGFAYRLDDDWYMRVGTTDYGPYDNVGFVGNDYENLEEDNGHLFSYDGTSWGFQYEKEGEVHLLVDDEDYGPNEFGYASFSYDFFFPYGGGFYLPGTLDNRDYHCFSGDFIYQDEIQNMRSLIDMFEYPWKEFTGLSFIRDDQYFIHFYGDEIGPLNTLNHYNLFYHQKLGKMIYLDQYSDVVDLYLGSEMIGTFDAVDVSYVQDSPIEEVYIATILDGMLTVMNVNTILDELKMDIIDE